MFTIKSAEIFKHAFTFRIDKRHLLWQNNSTGISECTASALPGKVNEEHASSFTLYFWLVSVCACTPLPPSGRLKDCVSLGGVDR